MALKNDFYSDIFQKEQEWTELINKNLLNSIYCNLVLKSFYLKKKLELKKEYNLSNSKILEQIIISIEQIIDKIDLFNEQYVNSEKVNLKELVPLFLTNQMNNTKEDTITSNLNDLKKAKQILQNEDFNDDYLYDDFIDNPKTK